MSKPVVVIDPGHGGFDPGAVANGLKEKDLNLLLAFKIAEHLDGIKMLLTHERDIYVSLADRVALSSRVEPALFLSLHANAGGGRGFESFIYSGLGKNDPSLLMQKILHENTISSIQRWNIADRGPKKAAFYVLRQNPSPAVLLESLFIDNEREAGIWREPLFMKTLASGIALGIRKAVRLPKISFQNVCPVDIDPTQATPAGSTIYTVQVGAFTYIENARQRLLEAQSAGFSDAYIYQKHF